MMAALRRLLCRLREASCPWDADADPLIQQLRAERTAARVSAHRLQRARATGNYPADFYRGTRRPPEDTDRA